MTSASDPRGRMRQSATPFPSRSEALQRTADVLRALGTRVGATQTPPSPDSRPPSVESAGEASQLTA